jgi:hypothetical protein
MRPLASLLTAACLSLSAVASAQATSRADVAPTPPPRDVRDEVPLVGYTLSAFGASRLTAGVAGFAGVLGSAGGADTTQIGGGARLWGSPVDRLTLFVEIGRTPYGKLAPSATASVRIAGDRARGFAFGASASYRAEAFTQLAGEIELAALFSVARGGWHLDTNLVAGVGLEDEGELDGELKLRAGYDVARWLRVGVDGRGRYRLRGDRALPGGHLGDFVGGPEVMVGIKNFFVGASAGPTTVGVANGWGWSATGTFGGALL